MRVWTGKAVHSRIFLHVQLQDFDTASAELYSRIVSYENNETDLVHPRRGDVPDPPEIATLSVAIWHPMGAQWELPASKQPRVAPTDVERGTKFAVART